MITNFRCFERKKVCQHGWCLVLTVLLTGATLGAADVLVDRNVILRVGAHELSAYGLQKNIDRTFPPATRANDAMPEEFSNWLRRFLTQQVIIARALEQGFGEHPVAQQTVDRMARHVLSDVHGPWYETMYASEPVTPAMVSAEWKRAASVFEVTWARFPDRATVDAVLGPDFASKTDAEKLHRLEACREHDDVEYFHGRMSWPFDPLGGLASKIDTMQAGDWLFGESDGANRCFLHVHGREHLPRATQEPAPGFDQAFVHIRRAQMQHQRRGEVLKATSFSLRRDIARALAAGLRETGTPEGQIPERAFEAVSNEILFTYQRDGEEVAVTAREYARHFNQLFVRQPPRSLADIRRGAESFVVADVDLRAARQAGVDQTPRFLEDRRLFHAAQALDLFEREKLLPSVGVDMASIRAYYEAHAGEFLRVELAAATVRSFATVEAAHAWMEAHSAGGRVTTDDTLGSVRDIVFSHQEPHAEFEMARMSILNSPAGRLFGPIPLEHEHVVLLRGETLETRVRPFGEVEQAIRHRLEREALDMAEAELAAELVQKFEIDDRIDYPRWGVTPRDVAPWAD